MTTTTQPRLSPAKEILVLLQQGPQSLDDLVRQVSFTRHHCRVRRLLFVLWEAGDVTWDRDGRWLCSGDRAHGVSLSVAS